MIKSYPTLSDWAGPRAARKPGPFGPGYHKAAIKNGSVGLIKKKILNLFQDLFILELSYNFT